jgi:tetratricopeptide (TPR) repeat protein
MAATCNDDKARSSVETALLTEASHINNSGLPAGLIAWQPHLRLVADRAMEREDETGAGLFNELGVHLDSIGDFQAAWTYFEKAFEICKKVLGQEHPDTARSLNNLAMLCFDEGKIKEAAGYMRKAMAIY